MFKKGQEIVLNGLNVDNFKLENNIDQDFKKNNILFNSTNKDSKDSDLFWVVAVTDELNGNGYKINLDGIDFSRWEKNPLMSDNHQTSANWTSVSVTSVLGKGVKIVREKMNGFDCFLIGFKFQTITENGREAKQLWVEGFINSVSVTIAAKEWSETVNEAPVMEACELYDISFVLIPSYKNARNIDEVAALENKEKIIEEKVEEKVEIVKNTEEVEKKYTESEINAMKELNKLLGL